MAFTTKAEQQFSPSKHMVAVFIPLTSRTFHTCRQQWCKNVKPKIQNAACSAANFSEQERASCYTSRACSQGGKEQAITIWLKSSNYVVVFNPKEKIRFFFSQQNKVLTAEVTKVSAALFEYIKQSCVPHHSILLHEIFTHLFSLKSDKCTSSQMWGM